jgi:hypothetical protein
VDVVRHQAPPPQTHPVARAPLAEQVHIGSIVIRTEKGRLAAVATLRDVVRNPGAMMRASRAIMTENSTSRRAVSSAIGGSAIGGSRQNFGIVSPDLPISLVSPE